MRILRLTAYPPPGQGDPGTTYILDAGPFEFEDIIRDAETQFFVLYEFIEADDVYHAHRITAEKESQRNEQDEDNMAISFWWNAMMLQRVNAGGLLINPRPAPLSPEQCRCVLQQLAKRPQCQGKTIIQVAKDMTMLRLEDGEITLSPVHP
jgi:hypothetical protein